MIIGNIEELNQVKSVVSKSMSIVQIFLEELMMKKNLEGQTETEKALSDRLEALYQNSEESLSEIESALVAMSLAKKYHPPEDPPKDLPPWEGPAEE